ncbi:VC0807 family protein [Amycolatopsis benzoatilytica]|uniref:VC0807 family protein n=1 Tax=Amycolatopsis benzoatilytica TaxID=346045 RepID=UPI000365310B|nr:VC0807 family protein [Amycolatopsis benzoatilytica]
MNKQRAVARLVFSPTLLLNVVTPVIAYQLLVHHGVGSTTALMYACGFPLLGIAITAMRSRRLDPVAVLSLVAIIVGLAAGLVLGNGRILLVKDSIVTGVIGVLFLLSLLTKRPLIAVLRRKLLSRETDRPRRMTAVWGVVLVAEASVRVALSFAVSPGTLLVLSPLLAAVAFGPLALWTLSSRPAATTEGVSHGSAPVRAR